MIQIGLPCDYCGNSTVAHCNDATCGWSRCPRCHSYGTPGKRFVQWNTKDYMNPYTLYDVKVALPSRTFPAWLQEMYGKHQDKETNGG